MSSNSDLSKSNKEPYVQEFSVRVPKNSRKKHCIMRFKEDSRVKFREWQHIKLERENNSRDSAAIAEEQIPKFGAGSEFGREAREEAKKKKFGTSKKNKSENQPWILKVNGKSGKKFRGIQQGGFGDNVAYYIFIQTPDASIEAYPLDEWYNFQPVQRYKTLSAEEAEEVMNQKSKIIDYSNIMIKKRLRCKDEDEDEDENMLESKNKKKAAEKSKDFKISEMEEWIDSDDDSDCDDKEDKSEFGNSPKGKKKKIIKKKKKNSSDNEAFEDSDDGDEEGREHEYISDSSASESELEQQKEMKSVAEEDALKKLLASDEEDEDDESDKKNDENDENQNQKEMDVKKDSSDSSDSTKFKPGLKKNENDKKPLSSKNYNASASMAVPSTSSESSKRKNDDSPDSFLVNKRIKVDNTRTSSSSGLSDLKVITKDSVRRYLIRKPMTVIELLQKFRSQIKASHSRDEIALKITKILRDINPMTQNLNGKLYFSIEG